MAITSGPVTLITSYAEDTLRKLKTFYVIYWQYVQGSQIYIDLLAEMNCLALYLAKIIVNLDWQNLGFCQFPKKLWNVPCVGAFYSFNHGTHTAYFRVFLEMDKTAGAHSIQIYDYLSQIQRKTKAFLLIVGHNTEGPPISDWQWRHRMLFSFVGSQNQVNLVLFFKPWFMWL